MVRPLLLVLLLAAPATAAETMPITGLAPAKVVPDLCVYRYRVGTTSPECQTFCDQGFGYYYSYVWMEAARSFETALRHDPDCAHAWLGLSRALDKWHKGNSPSEAFLAVAGTVWQAKLPQAFPAKAPDYALEKARALSASASHREQFLIRARLAEEGKLDGVKPADRKSEARSILDELLTLYPDDQEGWFARAQVGEGKYGSAPFYTALLRINPLHPGANHELVHFTERIRRPALGWPNARGYMDSSPGIPHAFHMQAHLATRVGKWAHTTDWSWRAIELQRAYHRDADVKPAQDHQYKHHLEVLTISLVHDGRFAEADTIKAEAKKHKYEFRPEWFRMALARHDWAEAEKYVDDYRKKDKPLAAYYAATIALDRGDTKAAAAEVDILRQAVQRKKSDRKAEQRLWEVQGRLMCQTGRGDSGVKLFHRLIEKTKDDFGHHSWGGGALYMETWGIAALEAGLPAEAEEAFQEALAHDTGSACGALGMWAVCQQLGRTAEAERYLQVAHRCWPKADAVDFNRLKADLATKAENLSAATVATAKPPSPKESQ